MSYTDFQNQASSEKISLIFIYPRQKVTTFTSQGSNVWKLSVSNVVTKVFNGSTELDVQTSSAVDASNPWFYDITTNELWYYTTSTIPDDDNVICEYKLFFSNVPLNLSYDLQDNSEEVTYEPRVLTTVGFKSQIGSDQKNISITGSGTVTLQNNDGYFDYLFDSYIWENKLVEVYSYGRGLEPSEARLQYKGFVVNKSFNNDSVKFKIQDVIFKLDTKVSMNLFTEADGVGPSFVGQPKRQVYGKLEGLLCRSIDQVGDGYTLTGTVSGTAASTTVTGSGTSFLTELAMNDSVTIDTYTYSVAAVNSDTDFTISDTDGLTTTSIGATITSEPVIPNPEFNREFFVADHAIKQGSSTITSMTQLNRLIVADIDGYEVGDAIKIDGDAFTIFAISGSQIQLQINATMLYPVGTVVTKEPITQIYINGTAIDLADLSSIDNTSVCKFTLSNTAEYGIGLNKIVDDANFTFTNGSASVTYAGSVDLLNTFRERDWIKAEGEADATYMRIVDIIGTTIRCTDTWTGVTGSSKKAIRRRPEYINDESSVSINCSGRTKDGTSTGDLVRTGADVVKDLLIELGLEDDLDAASFDQSSLDNNMRMSIAIPYNITDRAPVVKSVINDINQSIFSSLSLKQDLTLAYTTTSPERNDTISTISDDDVIKWKFSGKETNSYKRVLGSYRLTDFNNSTKEAGASLVDSMSDKITDYDISNKEVDQTFLVYEQSDCQELAERFIHYNEQTLMELKIQSDLRLSDYEIGDRVIVDFARFINQPSIGDSKRVFKVTGIKKDFNKIDLILSDLGNLYNRSGVISANDSVDYSSAGSDDKRFASYITDDNGIITAYPDSINTNLIS